MRMQPMRRLILILAAVMLGLSTSAALAKTSDGETPAVETWCDQFEGAAFGICNAYCEAQDCDAQDPQSVSCDQLAGNFLKKTDKKIACSFSCEEDCENQLTKDLAKCGDDKFCTSKALEKFKICVSDCGGSACSEADVKECGGKPIKCETKLGCALLCSADFDPVTKECVTRKCSPCKE